MLQYVPTTKQAEFHKTNTRRLLIEGPRGSGKTTAVRMDAHIRAAETPNFTYVLLRMTEPELRRSNTLFLPKEMAQQGGRYLHDIGEAQYSNGSNGVYVSCGDTGTLRSLLCRHFDAIYFDELTTFSYILWSAIIEVCGKPDSLVRASASPIGVSTAEVRDYFVDRSVLDAGYDASAWGSVRVARGDNSYINDTLYVERMKALPIEYRKAWIEGEWS